MYPKLSTRKFRHFRGRFTFLQFHQDHHNATFSCTLVSNDSTKKYVLITKIKYLIFNCFFLFQDIPISLPQSKLKVGNRFVENQSCEDEKINKLGIEKRKDHDFQPALQAHQLALEIRIKQFGEEHQTTADSYHSLGVTQHQLGDFKAALQSHQRALDIRIKLFGEEHQSTASCYYELGNTQFKMGDFKLALQCHQRALDIRIKLFGEEHQSTAYSYY